MTKPTPKSPPPFPPKKGPPLREVEDDNVVREEQSKGEVRPDGPGDATAPVEPER